jgi:hypothetical protein
MFPIEIWQKIFRYACVDGGRTGCALSLVSRRMHDISANIHLQSVFVVGLKRLQHLECTLRQLPEERRAVQALFIAARPDDAELHAWPTAYAAVLALTAPRVEVLTVHASYPFFDVAFPPNMHFPHLRDLAVGCVSRSVALPHLPSLRRLHVFGMYDKAAIRALVLGTPGPERMRFSGNTAVREIAASLAELRAQWREVPAPLKMLLVEPCQPSFGCGFAASIWFAELSGLECWVAEHQDRQAGPEIFVLPRRLGYGMERAAKDWRAVVECGRDGPWAADTAPVAVA